MPRFVTAFATAVCAAGLLAAGCAAPPAVVDGMPPVHLDVRPGDPADTEERAAAVGGAARIDVTGLAGAPSPCQDLSAEVMRHGRQVHLEIHVLSDDQPCAAVVTGFPYEAAITGLAPGTYEVVVDHRYPAGGWEDRTVLRTTVQVR